MAKRLVNKEVRLSNSQINAFFFLYLILIPNLYLLKNILFPFLILISSVCHAQWQQGDGPGGGTITSIFANGTEFFVSTFEGAVYKSEPSGSNRTMILQNQGNPIADQIIKLRNRIYVQYRNPLDPVFSDDEGVTWINDTTNECPRYHKDGIFFRDTTFTLDSGTTWINNSVLENSIEDGFRSTNETFLVGNNKLFRTFNNGLTWDTLFFSSIPGSLVKSGSNYISTSGEISLDSGLTWNPIPLFSDKIIKHIEHDNFSVYILTDTSGLFFSQDNGMNWSQVTSVLPQSRSLNFMTRGGDNIFVTGYLQGVFVSSDHGLTWNMANQNLNSLSTYVIAGKNSTLFAGTINGVFKSLDQGLTWVKIDAGTVINSSVITDIFIDNGNIFIVCGREAYLSTDNGINWSELNLGPFLYDHHCMASNDSLIFLSGQNGLYISADHGTTWSFRSSTPSTISINSIAVLNQNVFLSQWDSLVISNDNGMTWGSSPVIPGPILSVNQHDNKIYVCSQTVGIICSSDSGLTWTNLLNRRYINHLYVTDSIIWAPNVLRLIFYSFDGGITFDSVNTPDNFYTSIGFALNSGYIFAGMEAGGIWRTPYMNPINTTSELVDEPLTLFPNPAVNSITVKDRTELFVYEISDPLGRKIKKGISFGTIDISFLKAGEYYLSTYDNSGPAVKFIKQN